MEGAEMSKSRANKANRYRNQVRKQRNDIYKMINGRKGKR